MGTQPQKVTVRANTQKLLQTLKQVNGAVGKRSARTLAITSEITVTDGKITIAIPGAIFSLVCINLGTCKASVPFLHFLEVAKEFKAPVTEIIFIEGAIILNTITLFGKTTFFEDDTILKTIDLPINYSEVELIRLSINGYTIEELEFNNLKPKIDKALERLDAKLDIAYLLLKQYGVTHQDIEQITKKRLYAENFCA
jgi:hypothetical protein